ncbi:MAG: hypothetical protein ACXWZP_01825 [Gaiellaceae bacterium]
MGLKDTVLGWVRRGPADKDLSKAEEDTVLGWARQSPADKDLENAEEDFVEREYEAEKVDRMVDSLLGTSGDHFDGDQSAPR